nr:immunoglobulin light chain junction region [Macaca mulatta]
CGADNGTGSSFVYVF